MAKRRTQRVGPLRPRTYSWHQDAALDWCIARYGTCPFGCAKDGALNCQRHVAWGECEPGRRTMAVGNYPDAEGQAGRENGED